MNSTNLFSANSDIRKNAYLNWRTSRNDHINNMFVMGTSFYQSAILLTDTILTNNSDNKADGLIFPILFNFNHAIETYLKATVWLLKKLLKRSEKEPYKSTHDLDKLFDSYTQLIRDFEGKSLEMQLGATRSYITELYKEIQMPKVTKNGEKKCDKFGNVIMEKDITFARYALTMDGQPQFYVTTLDNVVIDIENLVHIMKNVYRELSGLAMHYEYLLEVQLQMELESLQLF